MFLYGLRKLNTHTQKHTHTQTQTHTNTHTHTHTDTHTHTHTQQHTHTHKHKHTHTHTLGQNKKQTDPDPRDSYLAAFLRFNLKEEEEVAFDACMTLVLEIVAIFGLVFEYRLNCPFVTEGMKINTDLILLHKIVLDMILLAIALRQVTN